MGWIVARTGAGSQRRVGHPTREFLTSHPGRVSLFVRIGRASLRWLPGSITQSTSPTSPCPANSEILSTPPSRAPLRHLARALFSCVDAVTELVRKEIELRPSTPRTITPVKAVSVGLGIRQLAQEYAEKLSYELVRVLGQVRSAAPNTQ